MENIVISIEANNKPTNLPSLDEIIHTCRVALKASTSYISGTPLVNKSDGITLAWVKFGRSVTMQEAQTQRYVAQFLNDKADPTVRVPSVYLAFQRGPYGYIVMEYIKGRICNKRDAEQVAAAVQSLIAVPARTTEPGPVGGGPIDHSFFMDGKSSVTYKSVPELEAHINGVSVPLSLALPCPSCTFAGFRMITLNTDSGVCWA